MYKSFLFLVLITANFCYAANAKPKSAPAITVYTAGDIAECTTKELASYSEATAKLIQAGIEQNPSAIVVTIGDHAYQVGSPVEFSECYDPSWGQFKSRTYPNPGNHDYYSPKAYGYFQYFGIAAGSQERPYYSFNQGSWHIISLDSNLKEERKQAQLAWLAEDLKTHHSSCILAVWHHPLYSSGLHGNSNRMKEAWDLLMAAKADVVLSSHDHLYERFALQNSKGEQDDAGIREFLVGTGGAKLTPALWQKQNSEVLNARVHGVLKLTLNKRSYDWQFLPIEGNSFSDKGSAVCHSK